MAMESLVKSTLVRIAEKSGIKWTICRTWFRSIKPNMGPCSSVSGRKPTLSSCCAPQLLCPSGESNLSHWTKRMSIHEGGLRPAPPSVLLHTMKWYIPIILVCQYGNASVLSSWDRTMMSACVWGLVDSSILHASYVVDLNLMVLCLYIQFWLMRILSCSWLE